MEWAQQGRWTLPRCPNTDRTVVDASRWLTLVDDPTFLHTSRGHGYIYSVPLTCNFVHLTKNFSTVDFVVEVYSAHEGQRTSGHTATVWRKGLVCCVTLLTLGLNPSHVMQKERTFYVSWSLKLLWRHTTPVIFFTVKILVRLVVNRINKSNIATMIVRSLHTPKMPSGAMWSHWAWASTEWK